VAQGGFTLPELLIAASIFGMVVAGVVATNLFGMRMTELTEPKLLADLESRRLVNLFVDDISSAKRVLVGDVVMDTFTPVATGQPLLGNAIQIHHGTNTTDYVRYHLDAGSGEVLRIASGEAQPQVLTEGVTNVVAFRGEDFAGNVLTNSMGTMVVHVMFQYEILEGTRQPLGPDERFKGYQFQTRVTWRTR
jgi:prepilin-type N-terminal cleavage/methylation domain-containing protein